MDPFTILAAASAASTVIVNLTTTISEIMDLCHRIKTADDTLLALLSQLNTMKSALDQVERLMESVEHDYQLRIDLDIACQASMMQIKLLDEQIAKFKTKSNRISELRLASKIKVVTKSQGMEACLTRLDRQTNALNLLVTVLTSRSVTDQTQLLEKSNARQIFEQIREDTATLNEQDERKSFTTAASTTNTFMTKPSQVFTFDSECTVSRPYNRSFRGLFRRRTAKLGEAKVTEISIDDESTVDCDSRADLYSETLVDQKANTWQQQAQAHHYSSMLALERSSSDVRMIVRHAQSLWGSDGACTRRQDSMSDSDEKDYKLTTRFFDVNIHVAKQDSSTLYIDEALLARYRDASAVLFAIKPATYIGRPEELVADLQCFEQLASDYHLCLAMITLYIDTTDLVEAISSPSFSTLFPNISSRASVEVATDGIMQQFMSSGRMGVSKDRVHYVAGEPSGDTAGHIFANVINASQLKSGKWKGLESFDM